MFSMLWFAAMLGCGPVQDATRVVDRDGDGWPAEVDCDDLDATRYPTAEDSVGDRVDQDCDGVDGVDADGDGEPSVASGGRDCEDDNDRTTGEDRDRDGWPSCLDCDDTDERTHPSGVEACDGADRDCDGTPDASHGVGFCEHEMTVGVEQLDVLVVLDNSCSMGPHQDRLALELPELLDGLVLRGADFHLGVISTDVAEQGMLVGVDGDYWISLSTVDPGAVFRDMAALGTEGDNQEKGFDQLLAALEAGGTNEGFLRPTADLDVLFVSDENDFSVATRWDVIDALTYLRPAARIFVDALVSVEPDCDHDEGEEYVALAEAFAGHVTDICSEDWTAHFQAMLGRQTVRDPSLVPMPDAPRMSTVVLTIDEGGVLQTYTSEELTWDIAAYALVLPTEPAPGAQIHVLYAPL